MHDHLDADEEIPSLIPFLKSFKNNIIHYD
jgi:hypothetical protein